MKFKRFYFNYQLSENALFSIDSEFNNSLLLCGGAAGHMSHPYDNLSPTDFLDFFQNLFDGNLSMSEKVDGVNLLVGLNDKGQLTYARNPNEAPVKDINKYFPASHPASDVFQAGFKALQQGIKKLSKEELIEYTLLKPDGTSGNFLNLEIIYGEIPNMIQYSDTDNFIIFHGLMGNFKEGYIPKDIDVKVLDKIAKKMGNQKVKSKVVKVFGSVGKVKKVVTDETSNWIIKGQIQIPNDKIRNDLESAAKKFKKYPEVKKLKNWKKLSKDDLWSLMKSLTEKTGMDILMSIPSALFSGKRKTPLGHPTIEGLAIKSSKGLLKITGSFRDLNQELWAPLKGGLGKDLSNLSMFVMNDALEIPKLKGLNKKIWRDVGNDASTLLQKRNPKVYPNDKSTKQKIQTSKVAKQIDITLKKLSALYNKQLKNKTIKKDDILKAIQLASFKLQEFKTRLKEVKTKEDLLKVFANSMYGFLA